MKKILIMLLLLPFTNGNAIANDQNNSLPFDPANTYVFIAGVLEWQSPTLSSFSNVNRKDEELYNLFITKGVPRANMIFLKDKQATLSNMNRSITSLLQKTGPQSTFIFYYAGHGTKTLNKVSFCNYDYVSGSGNGFDVENLSNTISTNFRGKQVWLMADCCYSGSLLKEGREVSAGRNVITLTSATASNTSTGNWTFTQTMIDCMSGLPEYDKNRDGKISLGEVKAELSEAMLYRERQMSGSVFYNIDESTAVGNCKSLPPNATGNEFRIGQYVYVLQSFNYEPGRILAVDQGNFVCELYHYSDKKKITVPKDDIKPIHFVEYPVGKKVQVEWNGKPYAAEILQSRNGFHYIHYINDDDSYDEWVMYDRITEGPRQKCSVEWRGHWYPAEVIQVKNGKYFIHYIGYKFDWDEWVGKERIRL